MVVRGLFVCALLVAVLAVAGGTAGAAERPPDRSIRVAPNRYLVDARELDHADGPAAARPRASASPRIVGGAPASIGEWPWQVALTYGPDVAAGNARDRLRCGATLLAPTLAVTAAHCLFDDDLGDFLAPELFATVTGRTQLSSSSGLEVPISTYHYFTNGSGAPLYDPATAAWDVALLELGASAIGTPIKLAGADERPVWAAGRDAYVTGWGTTSEGGSVSDILRAARVAMIGDPGCASAYGGSFMPGVMTCAGLPGGGADSCQGDSGGPLVAPIAGGDYRLIGDTSFGEGCGRAEYPGVYGRLADDPIRGALRRAVLEIASIDVVGSGAQPPDPSLPPAAPPRPQPPPGPTRACLAERVAVDAARGKLARAKHALRRADRRGETRRAKRSVSRARQGLKRAETALAACA